MPRLPALGAAPQPTAASSGVSVPIRSLGAEQQLLGTIGNAADGVHERQLKSLIRQNEAIRLKKERMFNEELEIAHEGLSANDPSEWEAKISESINLSRDNILSDETLAPALKDELRQRFDAYGESLIGKVRNESEVAHVEILKGEYNNRLDGYEDAGDFDARAEAIKEMSGLLEMTSPEVTRALRDNEKMREHRKAQDAISEGNVDYFNESHGLTKSEQSRYQRQARGVRAEQKRSQLDQFEDYLAVNPQASEEDVKKNLEVITDISPSEARAIFERWKEDQPTPPELREELRGDVIELRKLINDPQISYEEYWEAFDQVADELRGRGDAATWLPYTLQSLHPNKFAKERESKASKHRKEMEGIVNKALNRAFETDPSKLEDYENEDRKSQAKDLVADWLLDNPDATPEEIREKATEFKDDLVADSLFKGASSYSKRYNQSKTPPVKINPQAHLKRSDVSRNGQTAAIRYNNPAAAYPRKADNKYGLIGYGILKSGQGTHKIGRFPTPIHGAAANFDTFASGYKGLTVYQAVRKWRGNAGRGEKTVVPKGYDPNMKITGDFLNNQERATDFFRKMALHESAGKQGLSKSQWKEAWKMWKNGGAA